jgi:phosphoglycolate phosphatase-like HAD superfamily hydrolase
MARVPRPTIALFDIDGTLVSCGGAGRAAMERAFADLLGRSDVGGFPYGGMTDRAIVRAATRAAGRHDDDETLDALLGRYVGHLETELGSTHPFRVLDGVLALLDALTGHAHVAVGLGTGNLEIGARLKLSRGALWDRFGFGGYGSDHEDRGRLLAVGAARGAAKLGVHVGAARVVVIGDTPRDVHAGRAIGADVIAVATGGFARADLAGADLVVDALDDPRVLSRIAR